MPGAVRSFALDAVFPTLHGPVNDCSRHPVVKALRKSLCGGNFGKVLSVVNIDHIEVMKIAKFCRIPLNVIALELTVSANPV